MWLHMTLPKALEVGNLAADCFHFSVIRSEEDIYLSTIADSDTIAKNAKQKLNSYT